MPQATGLATPWAASGAHRVRAAGRSSPLAPCRRVSSNSPLERSVASRVLLPLRTIVCGSMVTRTVAALLVMRLATVLFSFAPAHRRMTTGAPRGDRVAAPLVDDAPTNGEAATDGLASARAGHW